MIFEAELCFADLQDEMEVVLLKLADAAFVNLRNEIEGDSGKGLAHDEQTFRGS